jgi:hypothetical protein
MTTTRRGVSLQEQSGSPPRSVECTRRYLIIDNMVSRLLNVNGLTTAGTERGCHGSTGVRGSGHGTAERTGGASRRRLRHRDVHSESTAPESTRGWWRWWIRRFDLKPALKIRHNQTGLRERYKPFLRVVHLSEVDRM